MTAMASVLVHVREQLLRRRLRRSLREGDRLVGQVVDRLLDVLDVRLGEDAFLEAAVGEERDRIAQLLAVDLLLGAVDRAGRVPHGVATEAIGAGLHQGGRLVAAGALHRPTHRVAHRQDVHAVHRLAVDPVGLGEAPDLGLGERAVDRGAHRVAVVLANEDHRQLPERGQVQGLVELAFGHRAVTEVAQHDLVAPLVLDREAGAGGERQVRAHDAVAAQEVDALVEEVHRAALALTQPAHAAEQLGHDPARIRPLGQAVAVLAIGRNRVVVGPQGRGRADRHRLLSDVEVEEAADLAEGVHLGRLLLEAPDQRHLRQQPPRQLRVEPGLGGCGLRLGHRFLLELLLLLLSRLPVATGSFSFCFRSARLRLHFALQLLHSFVYCSAVYRLLLCTLSFTALSSIVYYSALSCLRSRSSSAYPRRVFRSSTERRRRRRKIATMMASPTATSAAATHITKKTRACPSGVPCRCPMATSATLAAFSISSMDMKITSGSRRISTPSTPMLNSTADSAT